MTHLADHATRLQSASLTEFASARRADCLTVAGWSFSLARHRLDPQAEAALQAYGAAAGLGQAIKALFAGECVNPSESRAAMHWALRAEGDLDSEAEAVRASLTGPDGADTFARKVIAGEITATSGQPFRSVLHIGIGGSDFGPRLLADAFHAARKPSIELRFCANLDPNDFRDAAEGLDPAATLVIGVSKSFGTEETLYNLGHAREWLQSALGQDWSRHVTLVTANRERATDWLGGKAGHLLHMPETIGGRFSIWSAGSVACSIAFGMETIEAFRAGAAEMDRHVCSAPLNENIAMRLALLDYWNSSCLEAPMRVQLAYARRLRLLPAYLQQLEMESNGKSVQPDGVQVKHATAPALWGGEGTLGQHSFHQWLHQGTQAVPTEFILALDTDGDAAGQSALAAHALAQAEVLANGRSLAEVNTEEPGLDPAIAAQKVHAGGRPSTFICTKDFNAARLGALIALFEHRTYLAAILWGVNAFDQWGVERGKTMAGRIKSCLMDGTAASDPVTQDLISRLER